jgi:uncharacterized protein
LLSGWILIQERTLWLMEKTPNQRAPGRGGPPIAADGCRPPECRCYRPCCRETEGQGIPFRPEEIELVRLIDLDAPGQEEAAERLGVSRRTAWRDLHEARRKIADALASGRGITIAGCTKAAEGRCPKCPRDTADGT